MTQNEIEELKKNIFSDDNDVVISSADKLGKIGGAEVTDFLISLLSSESARIRHCAALALVDIGDNRSVDPLLTAIFKKENKNYTGTLVYALSELDCTEKLLEVFTILFYEDYHCKWIAFGILDQKTFEFSKEDLYKIEIMWEDCKAHPEKCPDYEKTKDDIEYMVNNYLSYIKPELLDKIDPNYKVKFVGYS